MGMRQEAVIRAESDLLGRRLAKPASHCVQVQNGEGSSSDQATNPNGGGRSAISSMLAHQTRLNLDQERCGLFLADDGNVPRDRLGVMLW